MKSLDIAALRKAVRKGRIEWRKHALQRLAERGIPQKDVWEVLQSGERIEDYPDDTPYPSALFLGFVAYKPLHAVAAFDKINQAHAKRIVLYLCKHRDRYVTRKELLEKLNLNMTDIELEQKLTALVKADIILQGPSNFRYRGVNDNIFDKVFRGVYDDEISLLEEGDIYQEYKAMYEALKAKYDKLLGQFNYHKGYYAEYYIIRQLQFHAHKNNDFFKSLIKNLPSDFDFVQYRYVWSFNASIIYSKDIKVDILARPIETGYAIIGEVKNRDIKKFSIEEAKAFHGKIKAVMELEEIDRAVGFMFSRKGFTDEAINYLITNAIAYSDDERWLDVEFV